jgi:hypothetical protein
MEVGWTWSRALAFFMGSEPFRAKLSSARSS